MFTRTYDASVHCRERQPAVCCHSNESSEAIYPFLKTQKQEGDKHSPVYRLADFMQLPRNILEAMAGFPISGSNTSALGI